MVSPILEEVKLLPALSEAQNSLLVRLYYSLAAGQLLRIRLPQ